MSKNGDLIDGLLAIAKRRGCAIQQGDVFVITDASAELRRLEARLSRPAQWQPIETAPKDADKVLLYSAEEGFDCGYWEGSFVWLPSGAWIIYPARSDTVELHPTHWMPLPEPPQTTINIPEIIP